MFRIAPSRSLTVLAEQLGIDTDADTLPEGRALLLSSDFYAVYQSLGRLDGVDNLWCWAHYPDLRVMPTWIGSVLVGGDARAGLVGIITAA